MYTLCNVAHCCCSCPSCWSRHTLETEVNEDTGKEWSQVNKTNAMDVLGCMKTQHRSRNLSCRMRTLALAAYYTSSVTNRTTTPTSKKEDSIVWIVIYVLLISWSSAGAHTILYTYRPPHTHSVQLRMNVRNNRVNSLLAIQLLSHVCKNIFVEFFPFLSSCTRTIVHHMQTTQCAQTTAVFVTVAATTSGTSRDEKSSCECTWYVVAARTC